MKVLIISHNPVSEQSSMGKTFLSLFSEFDSQELCQLYIYPTIPNAPHCGAYYRVTDKEALKSVVKRNTIGGEIQPDAAQQTYEKAGDESLYRSRKNKSALRRMMRDAMWTASTWYSKDLKAWLDREAPDCIFVAPGVAKFIYDFALRISKDRNLPMVTYVCDEYYFVQEPDSAADKLRLKLLKDKIDVLMEKTAHLVVISRELQDNYEGKFQIPTTLVMTGAAFRRAEVPDVRDQPRAVCYFGNVRSNRYLSLGQIGQTLDEINGELGTDYKLKIYSSEKDEEILNHLRQFRSVELCGFVSGAAFTETLHSSKLLLHVESFDAESIDKVRNSVSTKIADSLASGVPLVAYGPEEVSSMKHLMRHKCALLATKEQDLRSMLLDAFTSEDARRTAVENALITAEKYHDSAVNSRTLKSIMESVIQK